MNLVEGVNIGKLPDIFETLKNDGSILKIKGEHSIASLNEDYRKLATEIVKRDESFKDLREGQIIKGKIVSLTRKEIVIDINYKDYLYIDNKLSDLKIIENLSLGNEIDVVITQINDDPFIIKGSITDLIKLNISDKLRDYFYEDKYLLATVKDIQPAGFMLDIEMDNVIVNAFMPTTLAGINKLTEQQKQDLIDQKIEVMLETLQQEKGIYVVSRRKYLQSLIKDEIKKVKKDFDKDKTKIYEGIITGTSNFGIFVEFNECLTGMIHRFNVNEEWANDEKWKNIEPGMKINFYIKEIILKKEKLILTQILRESLWDTIKKDKILKGKVLAIKPFGALIQLDEETNGLIQNSYIQKNNINLELGKIINVKVLSIMRDERKIYLSVK